MTNSAKDSRQQRSQPVTTTFSVVERRVPCHHNFQFYVDYGASSGGPWVRVGINDTEFGIGYLPKQKAVATKLSVATPTAV